jgi:phosphatidylglycerophosphate synthase
VTVSTATATAPAARGPLLGLVIQLLLLVTLAAVAGLSAAGWLAALAYGIAVCLFLIIGLRHAGLPALGAANRVTLARALLVGGATALAVTSLTRHVPLPLLVAVVGVALALDGVDGQVARRTGSTSALGARFDMEVDAFLILVLSVFVAGEFGWWTIAIGAFRYLFVAAAWAFPWLSAALPPRFSRKVVAAVQGVVLVVATAHLLPGALTSAAVAAALISLIWSFGRDIAWLWRTERARRTTLTIAVRTPLPVLPIVRVVPAPRRRTIRRDPAPVG